MPFYFLQRFCAPTTNSGAVTTTATNASLAKARSGIPMPVPPTVFACTGVTPAGVAYCYVLLLLVLVVLLLMLHTIFKI